MQRRVKANTEQTRQGVCMWSHDAIARIIAAEFAQWTSTFVAFGAIKLLNGNICRAADTVSCRKITKAAILAIRLPRLHTT